MIKNNYEELLEKIKMLTKENKIEWKRMKNYIDIYSKENSMLRIYLGKNKEYDYNFKKEFPVRDIDLLESFVSNIGEGKIYLFKKIIKKEEFFVLSIQSSVDSEIFDVNINEEYQEELLVLKYLIIGKIDNTDEFINNILNM